MKKPNSLYRSCRSTCFSKERQRLKGHLKSLTTKRWVKFVLMIPTFVFAIGYCQIPKMESKFWYLGTGTCGLLFNGTPISATATPTLLTNKVAFVGYEGMVVANDPITGNLLFYCDGTSVIDATHNVMTNGTGIIGNTSGTQTVLCMPVPGVANKYYLLHHPANDAAPGPLYSTIVDFTNPGGLYPNGWIPPITKNVLVSNFNYSEGNVLISKQCTNDFWWVGHVMNTNQYKVIPITLSGFGAPATYTLTGTNTGAVNVIVHSAAGNKIAFSGNNSAGTGTVGLILADFNSATGQILNWATIFPTKAAAGNFSPDGSKLYFNNDNAGSRSLYQYDLGNSVSTNMNTCCYPHDTRVAPNGKMYHIHTYNSSTPIAVINCPNLSAVGNACGYNANSGIIGTFNGETRRFPTFLALPYCLPDTLSLCMTILSIDFVTLDLEMVDQKVKLNWSLSEECQGCIFEVERGNGGDAFRKIGTLPSGNGYTFSFEDPNPTESETSYRIVLEDVNGRRTYSMVISLDASTIQLPQVITSPNPCSSTIDIQIAAEDEAEVEIFDLLGKRLFHISGVKSLSRIDLNFLSQGTYSLKVAVGGRIITRKIMKL